jgi:hypothetical protein
MYATEDVSTATQLCWDGGVGELSPYPPQFPSESAPSPITAGAVVSFKDIKFHEYVPAQGNAVRRTSINWPIHTPRFTCVHGLAQKRAAKVCVLQYIGNGIDHAAKINGWNNSRKLLPRASVSVEVFTLPNGCLGVKGTIEAALVPFCQASAASAESMYITLKPPPSTRGM